MPSQRNSPFWLLCLYLTLTAAAPVRAEPQTIPGLGTTTFPTSTKSPEAQSAFLRGLLLLHLFEYSDAAKSFVAAERLDPAFALAYWGEAMTFNHGVWNQLDAAAGKAALDKFAPDAAARAARIANPREKAFMSAVELLYDGAGTKIARDKRYSHAMEHLAASYPDDRNAQLFYSLALLGQSESVRDVPVYLHAAAIAKAIFQLEPQNPGAAHYWIHGMDDPDHAAGALDAARALSKIAPDAPHAQHMCSHIFMALGMWDDVVAANVEAIRVGNSHDRTGAFPPYDCGHYANWLEYAYFQQGRIKAAQQAVTACGQAVVAAAKAPDRVRRRLTNAFSAMRDMAVIESQDWTAATKPAFDKSLLTPDSGAWSDFVTGYAAAQTGDLTAARSALESMRAGTASFRSAPDADPQDVQSLSVATESLSGLIQVQDGIGKASHDEAGIAALRLAVETYRAMAFAFGPPETIKPPDELLGEILLKKGDAPGARQAFKQSLRRAPGRAQSRIGLARAQQLAGDKAAAQKTYKTLLTDWHDADPATPALEEARNALSLAK